MRKAIAAWALVAILGTVAVIQAVRLVDATERFAQANLRLRAENAALRRACK